MRMDQATKMRTLGEGVKGSILAPNEARKRCDLKPVPGGDAVYSQQQNWSLEQLDRRDIVNDAPSVAAPPVEEPEEPEDDIEDETEDETEEDMKTFADVLAQKFLEAAHG
jgi:phage portal protein BeeE